MAVRSSNTNGTMQMEYAFAIVKASVTDGSQHVTITNCVLTLNKQNPGAAAIYQNNHTTSSTADLVITNATGASSHNSFTNNTISNTYFGIYVAGASNDTAYYDHNVDISGNSISNWAGGPGTTYGIYTVYQDFFRIANNTLNGVTNHTGIIYGI